MFPLCYSQAFSLCDKGSRAFHLFVHLCTYVYILLPESFHVNREQVITEREMALTVDAMNPLPLKKRIQVKEIPKRHAFKTRIVKAITLAFKTSWSRLCGTKIHQR